MPSPTQKFVFGGSLNVSAGAVPFVTGSDRLLTFPVRTRTPSYGSAFTRFRERYDAYSSGSIEFFAGMPGIANTAPVSDSYEANARLYNMYEGRWISPDPAGLAAVDLSNPQTLNRYVYVANNPLNAVDPGGEVESILSPNGPPAEGPGSGFSRDATNERR